MRRVTVIWVAALCWLALALPASARPGGKDRNGTPPRLSTKEQRRTEAARRWNLPTKQRGASKTLRTKSQPRAELADDPDLDFGLLLTLDVDAGDAPAPPTTSSTSPAKTRTPGAGKGLAESIRRLQTRTVDFQDAGVREPSRPGARERVLAGVKPTRRLSRQAKKTVSKIHKKLAAAARQHGLGDIGQMEIFSEAASDSPIEAFASAVDGRRVYLGENLVAGMAPFLRDKLKITDEAQVAELTDAMIAFVIGHELSHLWRRDVERPKVFKRSVAEARGHERAADIIGAKLAESAGFRPEGEYLAFLYLGDHEIKTKGELKKAYDHPTVVARAEKAYARMQAGLQRRGMTPLAPLPPPSSLEKQNGNILRRLRWAFKEAMSLRFLP